MTIYYGACALHAGQLNYKQMLSQYVILIVFPLQQRMHEWALMLRYTYNAALLWFRMAKIRNIVTISVKTSSIQFWKYTYPIFTFC